MKYRIEIAKKKSAAEKIRRAFRLGKGENYVV